MDNTFFGLAIVVVLAFIGVFLVQKLREERQKKEQALTLVKAISKGLVPMSIAGRRVFVLYCIGYFLKQNGQSMKLLAQAHALRTLRDFIENNFNIQNEYTSDDLLGCVPVGYSANETKFYADIREMSDNIKTLDLDPTNNLSCSNIYKDIFNLYYLLTGVNIPETPANVDTFNHIKEILDIAHKTFEKPYFSSSTCLLKLSVSSKDT